MKSLVMYEVKRVLARLWGKDESVDMDVQEC